MPTVFPPCNIQVKTILAVSVPYRSARRSVCKKDATDGLLFYYWQSTSGIFSVYWARTRNNSNFSTRMIGWPGVPCLPVAGTYFMSNWCADLRTLGTHIGMLSPPSVIKKY